MRRIPRPQNAIDLVTALSPRSQTNTWLCRPCQLRAASLPKPLTARYSTSTGTPETSDSDGEVQGPPYVPAQTWDGLEWFGSPEWVAETNRQPFKYKRFLPKQKSADPSTIRHAVQRAFIEVLTLREAGASPDELWKRTESAKDNPPGEGEEAKKWGRIPLTDFSLKFAVAKRAMQLTGIRVSDAAVFGVHSADRLIKLFTATPKPKNVTEKLEQTQALSKLPNVKVSPKKLTEIDKETEIGRWKVIEYELLQRGLPVTRMTR
ncbi:hypothetical protein K402DRAFT_393089 [Aulographum hederae CBS 113979]|uniref:Large ribosomal subunit protein mL50 n=1 Tax=Aulographum hederae CBS 113979 TaxID=1176131 RepID=A0A6G1H1J6_9PEZI|nr:hypothetical protein K402DRAFT_393089 [Aulographum hederae CBS 113979]